MQPKGTLVIVISLLFTVAGCSVAKRASRSPETDALLRAASAGNADTVRTLLASPNVDVNGIDDPAIHPKALSRQARAAAAKRSAASRSRSAKKAAATRKK